MLDLDALVKAAMPRLAHRAAAHGADDPEQVALDALTRLWRALERGAAFREPKAAWGYLWQAFSSVVCDERRGDTWRTAQRCEAIPANLVAPAPLVSDAGPLLALIGSYPPPQRRALLLTAIGYGPAEIAAHDPATYPTTQTVYDALRAGRARLRRAGYGPGRTQPERTP